MTRATVIESAQFSHRQALGSERPSGFFVTGTDTGVGKTWVAVGLLTALAQRGLTTAAMKPVASGCAQTPAGLRNDDALQLAAAAGATRSYDLVNPYAFAPAVAPHIAAGTAGVHIDLDLIAARFQGLSRGVDLVIVEGVGGWQVPLNERETVADLAARLCLPVILVVGVRLGCLNHALLTFESIERTGVTCAGWVANTIEAQSERFAENIQALRARLPAPLLGVVPHLAAIAPATVAASLRLERLVLPGSPDRVE